MLEYTFALSRCILATLMSKAPRPLRAIHRLFRKIQDFSTPPQKRSILVSRIVGLVLGPVVLATVMAAPMRLTNPQQALLGLILMTVIYWITSALPIPITSIWALALAVILGIDRSRVVFGAFSSPTLFLLIGGFIITQSMIKYGLGHRIALRVLLIPGVAKSTYRIIAVFGMIALILSSVIDNAAIVSMMLPVAIGLLHSLEDDIRRAARRKPKGDQLKFSSALMLITAYAATIGALITPFGDGATLVGWYFIGEQFNLYIPVSRWAHITIPIIAVLYAVMLGIVLLVNRPEAGRLPNVRSDLTKQLDELGPMSKGERNTAIAFCTAVVLWLTPTFVGVVAGHSSSAYTVLLHRLNPAVVAVLAATMLFMLPLGWKEGFTMRWRDVICMNWGPVLLMGSGLALAHLMEITKLAEVLGEGLAARIQGIGPLACYLLAGALAMMFSELTSNIVSISIMVPLIPTMAVSAGGDPLIATMVATFAALYGFMLPISTSANVIVYGSGQIPFLRMVKTGILVDLSGVLILVLGVLAMLSIVGVN